MFLSNYPIATSDPRWEEIKSRISRGFERFEQLRREQQERESKEAEKSSGKKVTKKIPDGAWSSGVDFSSWMPADLKKKLDEIDRKIESITFDMDDLKDLLARLPTPSSGNCDKDCKGKRRNYNKKIKNLKKQLPANKFDRKKVYSEIKARA